MSDSAYMGELRLMSFNFPPKYWAECNGQLLPINQNQALFSLLGTTYGGNGQTNFALPDLRGRTPIHRGAGFTQGQAAGQEFHTVTLAELPAHNHAVKASSKTGDKSTLGALASANNAYGPATDLVAIRADTIPNIGGSQPHENRPPSLALVWCIALSGIFPSQN